MPSMSKDIRSIRVNWYESMAEIERERQRKIEERERQDRRTLHKAVIYFIGQALGLRGEANPMLDQDGSLTPEETSALLLEIFGDEYRDFHDDDTAIAVTLDDISFHGYWPSAAIRIWNNAMVNVSWCADHQGNVSHDEYVISATMGEGQMVGDIYGRWCMSKGR